MSIDRWIDKKDVVHIYNEILFSHKKIKIMPFAVTWMQLETIILSKSEKDKYYMVSLTESKILHRWTYPQNRNKLTDIENNLWLPRGRDEGGKDFRINNEEQKGYYTQHSASICAHLPSYTSSLVKCLLKSFDIFYWIVCLLLSFESFICLGYKFFVGYVICKYFLPVLAYLFIISTFYWATVFNFEKFQFINFTYFMDCYV